ncbi:MAG: TonB-dependent receptor, partial [Elusimicrobiota bacterium]
VEYNNFTNSSEILPALYVRKDLRNDLEFHFIVNRSYRLPSFTELYYEDLVNKGDSGLKSESSWNFTGGASFPVCKYFRKLSCDLFLREESNLIDWLETSAKSNKYNAVNIGSVKRQGVELRGTFKLSPLTLYAGYNFIENATGSLLLSGRNSKYALRNPVHHTFAQASVDLPFGVKNNWNAVYKDRKGEKPYTVVSADFSKKYSDFNVSLSILNVFDAAYEEILGVTQAGRRVELNVTYTLF